MSLRVRRLVLVVCVAAAGCGKAVSSGDDGDAADDGDDGGDDAGDDTGDDGGVDAGDQPDAAGTDGGPGLIHVFARNYTRDEELILESTITARFGGIDTETCTILLAGSECRVFECEQRELETPRPDAGTITIEGLQDAALMPDRDGVYPPRELDAVILSEGGEVSALSTGGQVPAFEILDLVAPFSIGILGGVPTASSPITLSAAADYSIQWGGIRATDVVKISMTGPRDGDGRRRFIGCTLAAGNGEVTMSSEALQLLPAGDLQFEAHTETSTTITAGEHQITLTAAAVARIGDDASADYAAGTVMLGP